jgi:hypothetical protein
MRDPDAGARKAEHPRMAQDGLISLILPVTERIAVGSARPAAFVAASTVLAP